ncbi:MAG: hypothetical protein M1269_05155 [Chloroflexi bacterium]|nr:hypothetical protein [Chloroflexota bacterium]
MSKSINKNKKNWKSIREKYLGKPEVAEEYNKLPPVRIAAQIINAGRVSNPPFHST